MSTAGVPRQTSRRVYTAVALVFALLVCVVGFVLAWNSLTAGDDGDPTVSGGGVPATAPAPEAAPPADQVGFVTPTGNIGCIVSSTGARCDIAERGWEPSAQPESCTATWGQGLALGADGAGFVCAADSVVAAGAALPYGQVQERGQFRCLSSEEGVRCEDTASGRGFLIARDTFETF